jgi:hypothetical protein
MSPEWVTALATLGTFLVIAASAMAALMQLRHMRVSTQLEGLLSVLARVEDANFNSWLTETQRQLPAMLADKAYVKSIIDNTFDRNVAWLQLGNSYDWVGSLVKNRLIPMEFFLDVYAFRIVQAWELMRPITVLARHRVGNGIWENFEFLYVVANDWVKGHAERGYSSYPKHVRRVELPAIEEVLPEGLELADLVRNVGSPAVAVSARAADAFQPDGVQSTSGNPT